jgi:hypothetical protein
LCGNEIISAVEDRPNLYFMIDRSGSMSETVPGSTRSKYEATLSAIATLLRAIGHRVNYGAAVFPAPGNADACAPGREVFATRPGDPLSYAEAGQNGPVLTELARYLVQLDPDGGTPTSSTLNSLLPTIAGLEGRTVVILATDGAPNCNEAASCPPNECEPNLAQLSFQGIPCDSSFNCCDPANVGPDAQLACVDIAPSELAVKALADAGIDTYVIGMAGSELFASVLDRLAIAGNTARDSSPRYYAVRDTSALEGALRQIGVSVSISCAISLLAPPPDQSLVNVYFDTKVLAYGGEGWQWTGEQSLEIVGAACTHLLSGDVLQVQVVSGCPTVIR